MNCKYFVAAAAALSLSVAAGAQQVDISPLPQSITWGEKAFDASTTSLYVTGTGDAYAQSVLTARFGSATTGSVAIITGERGEDAVAAYESKIPAQKEGYYLKIEPNRIIIAGNDEAGTFYGAQTLLQICNASEVMQVEITDYPSMANRGVVEGYYGNPWSYTERVDLFEFFAANKMNTYIYGPKDDPYHHSQWMTLYPDDKAADMAKLAAEATRCHVKFVWAMHPGNSIESTSDRAAALAKFEQMYSLGFRSFAVFFDDISNYDGTKQGDYLNYLTDNFVKKHSDVEPLIMCPSEYNRSWAGNGTYLSALGTKCYDEIQIMWTGNSVVDMINESDVEWFKGYFQRYPYIWLNYPVTDYCINHLLMGPFYGNDLTIGDKVTGFTANPMEYAYASEVSLFSNADYMWNTPAYDADKSWELAMKSLGGEHADAYRTFCINNVDLGSTTHGLRRYGESPDFKALNDKYASLTSEAIDAYTLEFDKIHKAAAELQAWDAPITAEIMPWIICQDLQAKRGLLAMSLYENLADKKYDEFCINYTEYKALTDSASNLVSRNYDGSLKTAYPVTGTLYIEPFIKTAVNEAVIQYKASGAEVPEGLFPSLVLESGDYYIKWNGKWLGTNSSTYPTFATKQDDVNPDRQIWRIALDASTGRYSIVNAKDQRYVNELGNFGTNEYSAAWNTYVITRSNGKYAIQNGGSAGDKYWQVSSSGLRVEPSSSNTWGTANYVFEIIPVSGEVSTVDLHLGEAVCILDNQGRILTRNSTSTPVFTELSNTVSSAQKFIFSVDSETDRYKLVSATDQAYVNELGVFGTNQYYATWNSYIITDCGGKASIQNAGDAGSNYWYVEGNTISNKSMEAEESFLFTITADPFTSAISEILADDPRKAETFDLQGRRVDSPSAHGLYIVGGKKVIK